MKKSATLKESPNAAERVRVRTMTEDDFDDIIALQLRCFPGMKPWAKDQLESHVRHFPEGQFVAELDGQIVGSASGLILEFDDYNEAHSFQEITAGGTIANHDPEGSNLYGMEVMVDPTVRRAGIGRRLYEARKKLCEELNLESIIIAGRIPNYEKMADELSAKQYVERVIDGDIKDLVLTFQMRNGFRVKRIIRDYLPSDQASRGYAVLLEWPNLLYRPPTHRTEVSSHPVRVCVIQYQMRKVASFEEFAKQTEYFADVASDYGSDFAVFPELLTTQLLSAIPAKDPAEAIHALAAHTDAYERHFAGLAKKYDMNIVAGTHIVEMNGRLRNVAYLFRRDGTYETQQKLHITPNERKWWGIEAGDGLKVIQTDVGPVAIHVCYDVEFPELSRIAVDQGARILFVPFCTEDRQGYLRVRYCAQSRAVENQVYVVTAGTVGNLPETRNMDVQYAQSGIYTPSDYTFPRDGIAAETTPNVETIIVGDIDLEVLRRHRRRGSVQQLLDRRKDLYEVTHKPISKGQALH